MTTEDKRKARSAVQTVTVCTQCADGHVTETQWGAVAARNRSPRLVMISFYTSAKAMLTESVSLNITYKYV